jgi:hypothetical protein
MNIKVNAYPLKRRFRFSPDISIDMQYLKLLFF